MGTPPIKLMTRVYYLAPVEIAALLQETKSAPQGPASPPTSSPTSAEAKHPWHRRPFPLDAAGTEQKCPAQRIPPGREIRYLTAPRTMAPLFGNVQAVTARALEQFRAALRPFAGARSATDPPHVCVEVTTTGDGRVTAVRAWNPWKAGRSK